MPGDPKPTKDDAREKRRDETLDLELEQSFPASDPPSSTQPGTRSGEPKRQAGPSPGKDGEASKPADRR
jgi:hypothetical protein